MHFTIKKIIMLPAVLLSFSCLGVAFSAESKAETEDYSHIRPLKFAKCTIRNYDKKHDPGYDRKDDDDNFTGISYVVVAQDISEFETVFAIHNKGAVNNYLDDCETCVMLPEYRKEDKAEADINLEILLSKISCKEVVDNRPVVSTPASAPAP